jgi:tRNA(Arg) A34 adenosine deaminase TadA
MREALAQARLCLRSNSSNSRDDVPIGAVCVLNNQIISRGHNQRELDNDPQRTPKLWLFARPHEYSIAAPRDVKLFVTLEPRLCRLCDLAAAHGSRRVRAHGDEKWCLRLGL